MRYKDKISNAYYSLLAAATLTVLDIGAAQATAAGTAIAASGILRDLGAAIAQSGALGEGMNEPAIGYLIVYHVEIALLFATLVAIGPLVRAAEPEADCPDEGQAGRFDPLVNRLT